MMHLPPELVSLVLSYVGPEACAALRDTAGLRLYLQHHGLPLHLELAQRATDACVDEKWSAGIDVLVDHGVLDLVVSWPTRGCVRGYGDIFDGDGWSAFDSLMGGIPTIPPDSRVAEEVRQVFRYSQERRLASLSLAPSTVKKLWRHALRVSDNKKPAKYVQSILAVLATHASTTDEDVTVWCCQQSPGFALYLGRLLIQDGKGIADLQLLCRRAGLCDDVESVAGCFVGTAASHGRFDLLQWCAQQYPHLVKENTWLLSRVAASGSLSAFRLVRKLLYSKHAQEALIVAASAGHLDVVKELISERFLFPETAALSAAACNHVHILAWVYGAYKWLRNDYTHGKLVKCALVSGALDALQWLNEHNTYGTVCLSDQLCTAVAYNNLHMAQWLFKQGATFNRPLAFGNSGYRSLDMIKWLQQVAPEALRYVSYHYFMRYAWFSSPADSFAFALWVTEQPNGIYLPHKYYEVDLVRTDQVHYLRTCRQRASFTPESELLLEAICFSSLEMVCWLDDNIPDAVYTSQMLDYAAARGSLALVRLVLSRLSPDNYPQSHAVDFAAKRGHLDVVRYLSTRVPGILCSTDAIDEAAAAGYLEVVQYLHTHRTEGCTTKAMDAAAAGGHLEVVQFLSEHRSEGCTTQAMDNAAAAGLLRVVRWLHENRTEGCTPTAMHQAAVNGWLHVVQYLHNNRTEGCTDQTLDQVVCTGNHTMLRWLTDNRAERCSEGALHSAIWSGRLEMVRLICRDRVVANLDQTLAQARDEPHIADWLRTRYGVQDPRRSWWKKVKKALRLGSKK
ncbi:hypothetical protein RI367_007198 [Sorochytrium milnesiophthora]